MQSVELLEGGEKGREGGGSVRGGRERGEGHGSGYFLMVWRWIYIRDEIRNELPIIYMR